MIATSLKLPPKKLACLTSLAALCLWPLSASAQATNLVTNGTFDSGVADPWWGAASTSTDNPADKSLAVTDGRLCVTMTAGGKNPWDVSLGLSGLALEANKYYRIQFSASADVDRTIKFKTGFGDKPYTDYFIKTIPISTTPKDFDFTYLNLRNDPMTQFQFQIGSMAGVVCVDNISITEVAAPVLQPYVTPSVTGQPLKSRPNVVKFGTAVDTPIFLSSPLHDQIVAGEFNMITPANSMKMNLIQPTQGVFDFTDTDALVTWANQNGLEFRGHPLVWHTQAPGWLTGGTFTKDQMVAIMYAHIDALMGRYKLPYWDVVNEAVDEANLAQGYRSTFWYNTIGPEFIDLAFQRARMDDPNAKLFYNDYNIEQLGNPKADRVFQMVQDLKNRGIPIDGVGLQGHYFVTPDGGTSGLPDMQAIRDNMKRYADLGLEVHITECDLRIGKPLDDNKLALQTAFYRDLLQVCVDAPNCSHFTVWGLSDIDSWVPSTFKDYDYAHLWDSNFMPKPGYQEMTKVMAKYNADGTPVGGGSTGASTDSGGCSFQPAKAPRSAAASLLLLGVFGAGLARRRKRARAS